MLARRPIGSSASDQPGAFIIPRNLRLPDPGGLPPPLPDPIPAPEPPPVLRIEEVSWRPDTRLPQFRALRHGCYLIRYTPTGKPFLHYDGTMRVQRDGFWNTIASGDLYIHHQSRWPVRTFPEPDPADGIPIFPIRFYTYYLQVTKILETYTRTRSFDMEIELYKFNHADRTWENTGNFTAQMAWTTAPAGYPSTSDYLEGAVRNSAGTAVGFLTMGWISEYLRRAIVEIDKVTDSEWPLNNGAGVDWGTIHKEAGWDTTVKQGKADVPEVSGASWNEGECHQAMLDWRDFHDMNTEWRYHLLCVREVDGGYLGYMYDHLGSDSNHVPREGAALASHPNLPDEPEYGNVRDTRFGTATGPYFRAAVHEIGHAMLLYHNQSNTYLMRQTGSIAYHEPGQFPDNIKWHFHPDDLKRLRHMPDIWVRPGGISWGESYNTAPISPDDMMAEAAGLELKVTPLLEAVPIGAPVRINYQLINITDTALPVPASLSMKTGVVKGKVVDPSGTVRTFSPLLLRLEAKNNLRLLRPGETIGYSVTLLRGAQGALFPSPGMFRIIIEITWNTKGFSIGLSGKTSIMVMAPVDEDHTKAALKVVTTPDALVTLVVGGDHLTDGIEAFRVGLKNPVLRPHFAYVEAKRLAMRFGKRKANLKAAADLITDEVIMSPAEIKKAAKLVKDGEPESVPGKKIAKVLKNKARILGVSDEIKILVDSL